MPIRQQRRFHNRRAVTPAQPDVLPDMPAQLRVSSGHAVSLRVFTNGADLQTSGILPLWNRTTGELPVAMTTSGVDVNFTYVTPAPTPSTFELAPKCLQVRNKWGGCIAPLHEEVTALPWPPDPIFPIDWSVTTFGFQIEVSVATGGNVVGYQGIPPFLCVDTGETPTTVVSVTGGVVRLAYATAVASGMVIRYPADESSTIVVVTGQRLVGKDQVAG